MKITLTIHVGKCESPHDKAHALFRNTGAPKFDGACLTLLDDGRYRFTIPQAFTSAHPAIRYLIDNA